MSSKREVWYCKGSPAAALARSLGRRYSFRVLPENLSEGKPARRAAHAGNHSPQAVCLADLAHDDLAALRKLVRQRPGLRLIGIVSEVKRGRDSSTGDLFACLPRKASCDLVERTLEAAFAQIDLTERERVAREELSRTQREMDELNRIGIALSSTRDVNALLDLILSKSRAISSADAGSLYLVEEVLPEDDSPGKPERRLRFKLTQNDSLQFPFAEYTMPISESSLAGYVARHGEVIHVADAYSLLPAAAPPRVPYRFNSRFDEESGYRTRSLLALPMKNARGEILGVLQLINSKRNPAARLDSTGAVDREVQPFSERAVRLALSLASQAAVAYENSRLYQGIEMLFEGFVQAAVTAIEQRDPTTSGHSLRVSTMTVGLAAAVDRASDGPFADLRFTPEQIKEIRYAALLHDFGKVGVREEILVKAKKLYPMQLAVVETRFDYLRKELEARLGRRKIQALVSLSREQAKEEVARLDEEFHQRTAQLDDYLQFIQRVNEPTILPEGEFDRLLEIAGQTYTDPRGIRRPYLTPDEVRFLSIPKGTLAADERQQVESHVVHSFNFLMQIPWTREIRRIPLIARAHHEKLNGSGYPEKLKGDEIPIQAKMMTICDIFDALSASDRPYKKALPIERALDILADAVRDRELDPALFQLFLDAEIFRLTPTRV